MLNSTGAVTTTNVSSPLQLCRAYWGPSHMYDYSAALLEQLSAPDRDPTGETASQRTPRENPEGLGPNLHQTPNCKSPLSTAYSTCTVYVLYVIDAVIDLLYHRLISNLGIRHRQNTHLKNTYLRY